MILIIVYQNKINEINYLGDWLLPKKKKDISSMKNGFTKIADFVMNYLQNRKENYGNSF